MGSFMILDLNFETKEDRLRFEAYLQKKKHQHRKLTNYHEAGEHCIENIVYYAGYLGYAEPQIIF